MTTETYEDEVQTNVKSADVFRPDEWDQFIGQKVLMGQLAIHIDAAIAQERTLDHVLLTASPGFGKTSLVNLIASRLGDALTSVKMPIRPSAMESVFRRFEGGVLFLDELQGASVSQQEDLLTVLEDKFFSTMSGRRIEIPFLTVIGATTEKQMIIQPLQDRFIIQPTFVDYDDAQMGQLIESMAQRIGLPLDAATCLALGRATGGTPRNGKRLVLAARDLLHAHGTLPTAEEVLSFCVIDADGLSQDHLTYLRAVATAGDVAGLKKISLQMRVHEKVLLDLEKLLVDQALIRYTDRGRELTTAGYNKAAGRANVPAGINRNH